jgi:hypothetical protein
MPLVLNNAEDTVEFGRMLAEAMSTSPVRSLYLFADLGGAHQCGILARNGAQLIGNGLAALFLAFDRFPIGKHLGGGFCLHLAKHVGMAVDHFFANIVRHVVEGAAACLLLHSRVHCHLKQYVAKLLTQKCGILVIDRLDDLIGLLNKVVAYAFVSLLSVPRTALL